MVPRLYFLNTEQFVRRNVFLTSFATKQTIYSIVTFRAQVATQSIVTVRIKKKMQKSIIVYPTHF